jgi:1-acyl-sn-glycerol-3-phosphate acyltransferase
LSEPSDGATYEPFEPDYLRRVLDRAFNPVVDHYFRPRLLGAHRLPDRGPLILAANHSGSAFPYDGMVLDSLLWRRDGTRTEAKFRSVYDKMLSQKWWMRPFGIDNFWRRAGGVDLTFDNLDRLLARGERVAYYPEGVAGIGKGFRRRYRLQPFSTSFVILAARHRAPVYPVHVVNAEWVIPFNFTLRPLDRLMQRLFGVPFLPLPGAAFAITFPWAWYLALPARMIFVVGEPLDMCSLLRDEGVTDVDGTDRVDRARLERVAERVRRTVQRELDVHVKRHGRRPFQTRSLMRALRAARRGGLLARVLPTNWAVNFNRSHRDEHRGPARGRLHAILRDWDLLGFFLPLGWPVLSLTRALRKPPCGYRGLGRAERQRIEGRFVWRLADRPLPPSSSGHASPRHRAGHG